MYDHKTPVARGMHNETAAQRRTTAAAKMKRPVDSWLRVNIQ
jgi:hypothetical protein